MVTGQLEFQDVYTDFQPKIRRYLARLAGEQEADDLLQETFIKVERGLERFRGESQLSTWIYRIATNTVLDRMRSASFRQDSHLKRVDPPDAEDVEEMADCDPLSGEKALALERQCVKSEMNSCLLSYIESLPESYRTVLLLSDLEELGNREIAEILGVTLETIKIRLHRARAKLREELLSHCEFYWVEELSWRASE
jgi:RNA polymerase sigma-70 factor, ECF subfamily